MVFEKMKNSEKFGKPRETKENQGKLTEQKKQVILRNTSPL